MALTAKDSRVWHIARDLALVTLSLSLLPLSIAVLLINKLRTLRKPPPNPLPATHNGRQPKVLVTGAGMAKGLFLARAFYLGGCKVVAADFEPHYALACGRFSKAVSRFYRLIIPASPEDQGAYIEQVVKIIETEQVDIWISCSGVHTALEDARLMERIENDTRCKAFQFNTAATHSLDDKLEFMKQTREFRLTFPKWFTLDSPVAIKQILRKLQNGKNRSANDDDKWMVKSGGVDDHTRGTIPLLHSSDPARMIEVAEELDYSSDHTYIMQHFIEGGEEYCTHSVVVDGQVKVFSASPSCSILLYYKVVDPYSALAKAMQTFTESYAKKAYEKYGRFTGHLSFDFLVKNTKTEDGVQQRLVPIECNPRCHTETVVFRGLERQLTNAYLSALTGSSVKDEILRPAASATPNAYYWIANDVVALYIHPLIRGFRGQMSVRGVADIHLDFWKHVVAWKDPMFEWWDPLPWLVLNHLYWPNRLLFASWTGTRWSNLNISTTKMFEI